MKIAEFVANMLFVAMLFAGGYFALWATAPYDPYVGSEARYEAGIEP